MHLAKFLRTLMRLADEVSHSEIYTSDARSLEWPLSSPTRSWLRSTVVSLLKQMPRSLCECCFVGNG